MCSLLFYCIVAHGHVGGNAVINSCWVWSMDMVQSISALLRSSADSRDQAYISERLGIDSGGVII